MLAHGVARGMRRAGAPDVTTYLARLRTDPAELDALVAEITVGETYFFRDPQQFQVIREEILPVLLRGRVGRPLRVWSAGCASGEEPYTLAIVLAQLGSGSAGQIIGTDISRPALVRARRAEYGPWSLRSTPPDVAARYFEPSGRGFALVCDLHGQVEFRYLNLAADTYPSLASGVWGMDLILCRNVLIYFDAATVERVAARLLAALTPDGWLVLGASDPPLTDLVPCEVVITAAGLAYRRSTRAVVRRGGGTRLPEPGGVGGIPTVGIALPPPVGSPEMAEAAPSTDAGRAPAGSPTLRDAIRAYEAREYPAATAAARQLSLADGADPVAWVILVRSLANVGDLEAAGRACAAGLDRFRTSAELAYLHGVLLAEAGRHTEGAGALRRALYLDRHLVVAHLALAAVLTRTGETDAARRALRNAARVLGEMPDAEVVTASDGERAGRLVETVRAHLALLGTGPP